MRKKIKLFFALLCVILITVIAVKLYGALSEPIFDTGIDDVAIPLTNIDYSKEAKSSFNALLIGTDASGELTDALMLVNIDKKDKTISMLSIPRDTKIKVDGKNRKINSCYRKGGLDLLLSEIKNLTQAPIHYYAIIEPGALADIVDSLGGVQYNVEQNMHYSDPAQDLYIDLEKGEQLLSGDQAEQYCRYRSYTMGDIERTQCQQKFFKALFEQKLNIKYVTKLSPLYNAVSENVKTNITFRDIVENITVMQMITDESQIRTFETPGTFNDMKKEGVSYYLIKGKHLSELRTICIDNFDGFADIESEQNDE